MRTNHVKALLEAGKPAVGAWLSMTGTAHARIMARMGFDWLSVDLEHNHQDLSQLAQTVAAIADSGQCAPLVRLPANRVEWFKWALDSGAWGVIVPMVNNREEAEQAVRFAKYPPDGMRSIGGAMAPLGFASNWAEYYREANRQILVVVQVESVAAMIDLDGIMATPGIDAVLVGPNDLHAQLGLAPRSESNEPDFVAALEQIKAAARRHDRKLGIYCSNGAAAAGRIAEGFQLVVATSDVASLSQAAAAELATARPG
jgi:4-hydroxy-2-oxoheptanedioate aldolase